MLKHVLVFFQFIEHQPSLILNRLLMYHQFITNQHIHCFLIQTQADILKIINPQQKGMQMVINTELFSL